VAQRDRGRERTEGSVFRIDLQREAAIPENGDVAGLVDPIDDTAIASTKSRVAAGVADELDPRAHSHSCPDASQQVSCAQRVHVLSIGGAG
jgi:hypothetical protein